MAMCIDDETIVLVSESDESLVEDEYDTIVLSDSDENSGLAEGQEETIVLSSDSGDDSGGVVKREKNNGFSSKKIKLEEM